MLDKIDEMEQEMVMDGLQKQIMENEVKSMRKQNEDMKNDHKQVAVERQNLEKMRENLDAVQVQRESEIREKSRQMVEERDRERRKAMLLDLEN